MQTTVNSYELTYETMTLVKSVRWYIDKTDHWQIYPPKSVVIIVSLLSQCQYDDNHRRSNSPVGKINMALATIDIGREGAFRVSSRNANLFCWV